MFRFLKIALSGVIGLLMSMPILADDGDKDALRALYSSHEFRPDDRGTEDGSEGSIKYRMLSPQVIEPGQAYPLVLFLHGAGERGDDNAIQLVHGAHEFARKDRREKYPAFVIFPQCPKGKRWVESDWNLESGRGQFPKEPSTSMQLALELVDQISRDHPVDTKRRFVVGLSMGGQGAWFAAAHDDRFAAMVEVCGGGDPEFAKQYAGKPIWAFHGQADNVVPVQRGREMIAALTNAGHAPELRWVEYPGVKHDSWTRTFARDDLYQWLFSQSQP